MFLFFVYVVCYVHPGCHKMKGFFPVKWEAAHEDFIFVMLDWPARDDPVIK